MTRHCASPLLLPEKPFEANLAYSFFTKKMTAQSQTQMVFSSQLRFCDFVFEKWLIGLYMDPFLTRFSILKMCTFLSGASFAGFFPIKWLSF